MAAKKSLRERKRLALSLDSSRHHLSQSGRALRRRLNPVRVVGRTFQRHPLSVFAATTAGAALLTWLLKRRARIKAKSKSLQRRLAGWVFSLLRPALKMWIVKEAKSYLLPPADPPSTDSLLGP